LDVCSNQGAKREIGGNRFEMGGLALNDTPKSESLDMVLPCIEAKRFEESMLSCSWLLQLTAAML